jgi:hypothetical protein
MMLKSPSRIRGAVSRLALRLAVVVLVVTVAMVFGPDGAQPAAANGNRDSVGLVDVTAGFWGLRDSATGATTSFYYGNPGDYPIMGDWNCDGVDTPGLYRQSDGFVYLRNSNTQGIADIRFFFGNPSDIPLAGDFNGDGCDTVSIYRATEGRVYIINQLGANNGGLGVAEYAYYFGNPGDKPFVGDFNNDGTDTVGLHRESSGYVYFRNTNTQGVADFSFFYGNPGDLIVAGRWANGTNPEDTVGIYRPSNGRFYLRYSNTQGVADEDFKYGNSNMRPVAGYFGITNRNPLVSITSPANLATFQTTWNGFAYVANVTLSAAVSDPDGDAVTVQWSSSVQGAGPTGETVVATLAIPAGQTSSQPTITATATDARGASSSASIQLKLVIPSP